MIGDLIALLFLSRDLAHRAHLKTTSYAQHMALGDFYEGIISLADDLAEAYQGRNGVIDDIPLPDGDGVQDIINTLAAHMKWVEDNRYKAIDKSDTPLQNIVDEVVALYLRTLYKLRTLR